MKKDIKQQAEEVKDRVKKLGPLKFTVLILMAVLTVCSYIFHGYIYGADSVFNRGISDSDFLNGLLSVVPNLISCIRVITIISIITTIVLFLINRSLGKSRRGITVARLANSLIKWIVAVVLVIVVLAIWGVDTTALITGAGVITLVVGLGLQSLIADVVAGLFIVFENEFNVGDYITVDGFRGEVTSIGIRTTQIELCGNVKVINNSEIVSLLNQSVKPSYVKVTVEVGYGEKLSRVEEVIAQHLQGADVKYTVQPLNYDGVANLGVASMTLQFSSYCNEPDYYAAQRAMNRRIKEVFDENGVEIPYSQVVVRKTDSNEV